MLYSRGDSSQAITAYEADFAAAFDGAHAVAFDHGRTAMRAILEALGARPGDEVALSAYTCHSVPRTLRAMGLTPVFVDIDPRNYGPSADAVRQAISPRTRAVLVQHSYGWPADVEAACDLARPRGIAVIEDCCQTLGARVGGRLVGTFGDAAFFSMQWNKPFSTGQGGMALLRDPAVAQRVRAGRDAANRRTGFVAARILAFELLAFELLMFPRSAALLTGAFRSLSRLLPVPGGSDAAEASRERPQLEPMQSLTALQAALGRIEVARLEQIAALRRAQAARLCATLSGFGFDVPAEPTAAAISPLRLPVRVRDPLAMIEAGRRSGIELTTWFDVPLDPLAGFRPEPGYAVGSCPQAERAAREIVLIPLGMRITERVLRRIEAAFGASAAADRYNSTHG